MKTALLACMYGVSIFSLAETLGISVDESQQMMDDFYASYPVMSQWIADVHKDVDEAERVETMFGRKRRFIGHKQNALPYRRLEKQILSFLQIDTLPNNIWEYQDLPYKLKKDFQSVKSLVGRVHRQSVNAIIQGTAADIMKKAMILLGDYVSKKGWKMVATVHDEIILEVPESISYQEVSELEDCMKLAVNLSIPMKVDTEFSYIWGKGMSKKEWFENKGEKQHE